MKAWVVVRNEQPLERIELPDPVTTGTEVVLNVTRCGVCHSDLHFWQGYYDMGGGKRMSLADRGVTLPRAPGHEVTGRVVALGPDAAGVEVGDERVVCPWIGCGRCVRCGAGQDNLCLVQRSLGVLENGGLGGRVEVPHPRLLVALDGIDPSPAATYACSGLTVYSAIAKVMPLHPDEAVLLIGAGGEISLSLAGTIFRAQSVLGSNTGTVADLRAVVALAQSGRLAATPIQEFPKDAANEAMSRLADGRVTGRAVLVS